MFIPILGKIIPDTGTKQRQSDADFSESELVNALFAPVQQLVLALLFGQPQRRYQSSELIRPANSGTGAVHRILTRLAAADLVSVEKVGNQKHYQANADSQIFEELAGLVLKTVGLVNPLRTALDPLRERIVAAFVYGSIAKGTERAGSDIDLMVIAEYIDYAELFAALPGIEATLARTVNPNLMNCSEWQRKRDEPDSFVARVASQPMLFVIGYADALAKLR